MRGATGWEQDYFTVESFRVTTGRRRRPVGPPRRRSRSTSTASASSHRRGQRPGQRARQRAAGGDRAGTRRSSASTSPTSRCACSTPQGHRRRDPGADRLDQRRGHLDDHRRDGEHHRGLVEGAPRLHRLRPAPHARVRRWPPPSSSRPAKEPSPLPRVAATPARAVAGRPARRPDGRHAEAQMWGHPGPDQGYAIVLANRFRDRLDLDGARDRRRRRRRVPRRRPVAGVAVRSGARDPRHGHRVDLGLPRSHSARRPRRAATLAVPGGVASDSLPGAARDCAPRSRVDVAHERTCGAARPIRRAGQS